MSKKKEQKEYTVYLGIEKGKRKYKKFTGPGAEERRDAYKARLKKTSTRTPIDYDSATFGQLAEEFITERTGDLRTGRGGLSRSQLDLYRAALKNCGEFRFFKIRNIFPSDVRKLYNSLYSKKSERTGNYLGFQSIKAVKSLVVQVLDEAMQEGYIDRNPAAGIKLKDPMDKSARLGRRYLTAEERAVIKTLGAQVTKYKDDDYTLFFGGYLLLYSGLRKGELIPLRVSDINLEGRYIDINKAVEKEPSGRYVIKSPKTLNSVRKVFIAPDILPFIKSYIELNNKKPKDLLITHKGRMYTESTFKDDWAKYTKTIFDRTVSGIKYNKEKEEHDAGLTEEDIKKGEKKMPDYPEDYRRITPHAFRRSYCQILGEMGVNVKTAQLQLGHADVRTTLEIYSTVRDTVRRKEVESFKIDAPEMTLEDFMLSRGIAISTEDMPREEIIKMINKLFPGQFVDAKRDSAELERRSENLKKLSEFAENYDEIRKKDEK